MQVLALFCAIAAGTASCTESLSVMPEAEVAFTATVPSTVRSSGDGTQANTLVVGVFKKASEGAPANGQGCAYREISRKTFTMSGGTADVRLTLARGQSYSFVFWAYCEGCGVYDLGDLAAIRMEPHSQPVTFGQAEMADAFFAVREDVVVDGDGSHAVGLVRPLAQINVGTTGQPLPAEFTVRAAPDTFYPFTNTVGGTADYTWEFHGTTAEKFVADGKEYSYLALGYLFAPAGAMQAEAVMALKDGGQPDREFEFPAVRLQANRRTNIAGNFTEIQ